MLKPLVNVNKHVEEEL